MAHIEILTGLQTILQIQNNNLCENPRHQFLFTLPPLAPRGDLDRARSSGNTEFALLGTDWPGPP